MAVNQIIAKKYALAAFNSVKQDNLIDQFLVDLKKFSEFFSSDTIKEVSNPAISKINLEKIIVELGEKLSLHAKVLSFLEIVAGAKRINIIKAIEHHFETLVKIEKKILEVEVVSAAQLSAEILQEVKDTLQKQHSDLVIEIKQTIKKDILGGLVIKVGSNMIDASLKRQLLALKADLDQQLGQ